jgi:hypothetical protein
MEAEPAVAKQDEDISESDWKIVEEVGRRGGGARLDSSPSGRDPKPPPSPSWLF